MSAEYSVEEVRAQAAKELRGGKYAKTWDMLTAYAERIEADERAVQVADDSDASLTVMIEHLTSIIEEKAEQPPHPRSPDASDSGRVGETIVAGALFDLMGFLTARDEVTTLSACHEASPAVIALEAFAAKRGLQLDEANVDGWRADLAAQGQGEPVPFGYLIKSSPPYAGMEMIWRFEPEERYAKDAAESMPIFTRPAPPASPAGVPDAKVIVTGFLPKSRVVELRFDSALPAWICEPGVHVTVAAAPSATPEGGEVGL